MGIRKVTRVTTSLYNMQALKRDRDSDTGSETSDLYDSPVDCKPSADEAHQPKRPTDIASVLASTQESLRLEREAARAFERESHAAFAAERNLFDDDLAKLQKEAEESKREKRSCKGKQQRQRREKMS